MDIRTTNAAMGYSLSKPAIAAQEGTKPSITSSDFAKLARDFEDTLQTSEHLSKTAMTSGADAHALVHALAQTELAVEAAVTVRDRVVEAYQEILRMPV